MLSKIDLKQAIQALFAYRPPKKELSTEKIREFVAEYLNVTTSEILLEELKIALRETPFALPKTMLRGSSRLGWYFVPQPLTAPIKTSKRTVRYKEKPLAETQKLKR